VFASTFRQFIESSEVGTLRKSDSPKQKEMETIPAEILHYIFSYFDRVDNVVGHFVCVLWHNILPQIWSAQKFSTRAAIRNYVGLLNWATNLGAPILPRLAKVAARKGRYDVFEWLIKRSRLNVAIGENFDIIYGRALCSGNMKLIILLESHPEHRVVSRKKTWYYVGKSDNSDVRVHVEGLPQRKIPYAHLAAGAAVCGNLDAVKYALAIREKPPWSLHISMIMNKAAARGRVHILEYFSFHLTDMTGFTHTLFKKSYIKLVNIIKNQSWTG
jgi:hypothetical protein